MKTTIPAVLSLFMVASFVAAATPPDAINYQGVLRDTSGAPLDGDYDMRFYFYDAATGGGWILSDVHVASGTGAVSVSGGLFNVALGTGEVSDGSGVFPGDPYTSLIPVFRDFTDVWVEIQIGQEVLAPRVKVISAGHALNADNAELLGGLDGSQFVRSDQDSGSSGTLTAADLRSRGDVYLNEDGPEGDSSLFFYGGSPQSVHLMWDDSQGQLETNAAFQAAGVVSLGGISAHSNLSINADGPDGSSALYFFDDGIPTGESLSWDDFEGRFVVSDELLVAGGVRSEGSVYINSDGPEVDSFLFFYDNGGPANQSLKWDQGADWFSFSDDVSALGEFQTRAPQIVIELDGPNGNQDIEFFNDFAQFERFQWDATAERFEVSDDFHAFGDLSTSGAKPFVQNHPYRDDLEIVYTAIEGNEVTTFTRGSARLVGGEARIELEESFRHVTNPDLGLSAHLTPRGISSVLYVESVSTSELVVRSVAGDDVAFDYAVYGLRVGYEDYPVYRPKRAESFAPMPGQFQEDFSAEPGLADHTALARYRAIADEVFGRTAIEMNGAWTLREAIGMREPDRDYPRGSELSVGEMNRIALEAAAGGAVDPGSVGIAESPTDESTASETDAGDDATGTVSTDTTGISASELQRDADGNVYARSFRPAAGDIASLVEVAEPVEAGDVLVIDPLAPGRMSLGREAGDAAVFGVVAAEPGVMLGASEPAAPDGDEVTKLPVAVSGVVSCKVDAGWGAIRPGDLLQTSPTPGHAMRADDPRVGTVLGKALEPLDAGTGVIRVLVTLR